MDLWKYVVTISSFLMELGFTSLINYVNPIFIENELARGLESSRSGECPLTVEGYYRGNEMRCFAKHRERSMSPSVQKPCVQTLET